MGLQTTLQELRLADNLLGDNLNPIFSSSEFHGLGRLRLLDLSGNIIKGIEEGILKGCDNLQVWNSAVLTQLQTLHLSHIPVPKCQQLSPLVKLLHVTSVGIFSELLSHETFGFFPHTFEFLREFILLNP
jgi:hypothetical protein